MSLSERLAALSPEQRELLRRRLAERDRDGGGVRATAEGVPVSDAPIPRRDAEAPLPLSHAQERLWFLNRLERDSAFYNIPMGLRMRGPLNADALERALGEIVRRHEVLRTTFESEAGVPRQVVHADLAPGFARVDRTDVAEDDRAEALESAARDEARVPFDMERGPLIRATLVRFAPEDHGFLLSVHHTVADGWSRGVLVGELERLYAADVQGLASPLAPLEIQYGDFAVWQREWLSGDRLETEMKYWEDRLAGLRELRLPTDRPRLADTVHEGAKLLRVLPHELLERIKAFSREARVTPFMALLAAFKVLLQRLSGEEDVVVGVPTANRNWPATESLIGFFVNSLVMRTDLSGDPSFRELLGLVRTTAVGAFEHRNVPFERIVERLRPERTLGRNPLFQVTLQFQDSSYARQNSLTPQHDFPGLEIERLPIDTGTALFDLSVNMGEIEEGLGVLVEYSTALWDEERIDALVRQLVRLLEDGMERPDAPISELAWLDAEDHSRALVHATQSFGPEAAAALPPVGPPVHQRVAQHAAERPDDLALVAGDASLSYADLVARARALATDLVRHGAGGEGIVAVCLPRGIGSALAPLAVLEAGAAYLPLDPVDPARRRAGTVVDVGAVAVVTDADHVADFADLEGVAVLDIASVLAGPAPAHVAPLAASAVDPEQLAYVIYTSGSTGAPKGVGIPHRGLSHLVAWQESCWPIGPGDRGTSLAGLGFDAVIWELWMTLAVGGTLVFPEDDLRLDPPRLAEWIVGERLSVVFAPTPIAERLIAEPRMRDAHALRAILSGGDKLTLRPDEGLPFAYVNCYGPAENSVVSTSGRVERSAQEIGPPPIGRPLPGVTAHVLDPRMRPVPVGAPGELYVGGRGLARGYHGRPGLTASRFVPDPFSREPGARLYRTGDRVRFLNDGRVAFLGRTDHQVKVRGARLELGEIEAVLAQHADVREVAVGTTGADGGRALVAFVVPGDDASDRGAHEDTQIEDWRRLYDATYGGERSEDDAADVRFDLVGWMSSYDGREIPRDEMGAWVEETVERIRALSPRRVLEIGSGTGLLLFRLAPDTERYVGVDFSAEAIERVRGEVERPDAEIAGVELLEARADEAASLVEGLVDTVVVNSVAQYFPSIAYLEEVIVSAAERVAPSGRMFLGDLRHADLDRAFHSAVALAQAPAEEPLPAVAVRAEEIAAREGELLVSPSFFHALARRMPRLRGIQVRPKRFAADNELSQFRYDVVLEFDDASAPAADRVERRAFAEFGSVEELRAHLEKTRPDALVVGAIPNARVASSVAAAAELFGELAAEADAEPAARLIARAAARGSTAVDPADLWRLGAELDLEVDVRWGGSEDGTLALHVGATGTAPDVTGLPGSEEADLAAFGRAPAAPSRARELATELRGWLEDRLPTYMVPERFVAIPALPLTNRGKVDRRRLAALDPGRRSDAARYVAPRNALEETIASVFGRVLSIDQVGARDDFFDLGGHSLLATRVMAELEDALGVALELRMLFGATSVEGLAEVIAPLLEAGEVGEGGTSSPIVARSFEDAPAPASFGQRRLWLLERLLPGTPAYHMPARARIEGPLDADRLAIALDGLVQRHESLRTALVERPLGDAGGLDVVQLVKPRATLPLERVDLSEAPETERAARAETLATEHASRPFALDEAPLARALLVRLGPEEHELVVTLHHAVADGWSVGIVLAELGPLYRAAGGDAELPELPITYRDYAAWQREDTRAGDAPDWWRQALADAPSRLALPTDRPRPPIPSFRGDRVPVTISPRATEALDALAREHRATRFMVALAAWQVVVRALSGEDDLVTVSPVAGRRRPETHGLVGFFVNTVPIRTQTSGAATFAELVEATRTSCLGAFDHADLSFEAILEAVRPDRSLEGAPFAQVAFALQNAPGGTVQFDDLTISLAAIPTGTAKTDLALMLDEPGSALGQEAEGLSGVLEFSSDLFDRATAETIARAFERVVEEAGADASRCVDALGGLVDLPVATAGAAPAAATSALVADRERSNLSDNQLLVWIGHQLDPEAPLHLLAVEFELDVELDVAAFEAAFDVWVRSSDVMRSVIVEREGVPRLEVREAIVDALERFDVSDLDPRQRSRRLHAFGFAPMDLSERTFRSGLFHRGDGRYTWLFSQHQIVSDAESLQMIAYGVSELYRQAVAGELPESVPMPAYLDHLAWEQAERAAGGFAEAEAHWQRLLADRPEPPRFYGSTGTKTGLETRRIETRVSGATIDRLGEVLGDFVGDEASRPVMRLRLFLSVLAAYLHRITGQDRVVVGMPWRNRRRETSRGTLGLFMRNVPIEIGVEPGDSLRQLFERSGPALRTALANGEQVVRNPIDAPVYDVALNLHTAQLGEFAGAPIVPNWLHSGLGFESLTLQVQDFGETGELGLEFDLHTDVFDDDLAGLTVRHVSTLLDSALAAPDRPIAALALERGEAAPRGAPAERVDGASVLAAFDAQVSARPHALAILDGERSLDYAELDRAASGVAERLAARGVGPGSVVALEIDRSAEILAAMLGVLRAGAAFLVLEPATPFERMEQMLTAAGVRWILAEPSRRDALPAGSWNVLGPVADGDAGATATVAPPERVTVAADDAAYVAFTSGSTGTPKGVVVPHGALASFAHAAVETYGLGANDRMLQFSSLAFDASIEEIFGALSAGAALVLRDAAMLVDPSRFVGRCAETGVTVVDLPTAWWQQLSQTLASRDLALPESLRLVILGGERLDASALAPWRAQAAAGRVPAVVNTYGPTETTVVVSHHTVSTEPEDPRRREVPIGTAFGRAELHVVDRSGAPAPTGVVGELLVGGPTVARGYAGLAAATAERFVPDPFSGRPGARLYRTGDLVRRRSDGALEFVGRADRQVKVRGHRVELAEVERALLGVEGVAEAAVLDVPAQGGVGRALVGFAVAPSLAAADLGAALGQRLPGFMVPSRWVTLEDALPRDARGKIDRRALLARVPDQPASSASYVAPRGEVERVVAEVWAEVLGLPRVGRHDSFFELGGTSLSLVQMHPALVDRLGVSLELVDLFRHPTVHALAQYLEGHREAEARAAERRDERAVARRDALARRRARRGGQDS